MEIMRHKVNIARIPEALCLIHEIMRIIEKWLKIMGHLKELLPHIMREPEQSRIQFTALKKLTAQEIVRIILLFVK